VSEIPAQSESSISVPAQLAELTAELSLPQARDPETRLPILTILGMREVNYDSAMARGTWAQGLLPRLLEDLVVYKRSICERKREIQYLNSLCTRRHRCHFSLGCLGTAFARLDSPVPKQDVGILEALSIAAIRLLHRSLCFIRTS
jgi:hypothetical protein